MAYLVVYVLVDFVVNGEMTIDSYADIFVIAIVQTPFMFIAFALVIYLNNTQRQIAELAMTDALTGLPNRRKFTYDVDDALTENARGFMLIVDADHFKQINDTYGHAIGDICLQAISERLKTICTVNDMNGRIGGEEFAAFLMERTETDIKNVGHQLTRQFRVETDELPKPLHFTLSVGAAELRGTDTLMELMRRADEALYKAKATGRARLVIWRKSTATADSQMPLKAS